MARLVHLPEGHAAEASVDAVTPVLATLPTSARLSLTWDQGSEMARHDLLAPHFSDGVYFARPGSPWLRGTNENTYWAGWVTRGFFDGRGSALGGRVTRRTRAGRLSVDLSTAARRARALTGSDLIEAC
jgi:hypothetical protein